MLGAENTWADNVSDGKPGTSSCSTTREQSRDAPVANGKWPIWFNKCIIA